MNVSLCFSRSHWRESQSVLAPSAGAGPHEGRILSSKVLRRCGTTMTRAGVSMRSAGERASFEGLRHGYAETLRSAGGGVRFEDVKDGPSAPCCQICLPPNNFDNRHC